MSAAFRIGLTYGGVPRDGEGAVEHLMAFAEQAEASGFSSLWLSNDFSWDPIATAALLVGVTRRIELGSAVAPIFSRHPVVMAQEALSISAVSQGRFSLGIGLSHKMIVEEILGLSYERPHQQMAEYLSVLVPLLGREANRFIGEMYRVSVDLWVPGTNTVPLMMAASDEQMFCHVGRYAAGLLTWLAGAEGLRTHVMPHLRQAAQQAERATPRVIVGLPIVITDDVTRGREAVDRRYGLQGQMPSHEATLEREGAHRVSDVALIGSEDQVLERLHGLAELGMTDFNAAIVEADGESIGRTLEFLTSHL